MAEYATKDEVQNIVNKAVDDISTIIQSFAQNVDERFDTPDVRNKKVGLSLDQLTNTLMHL